MNPNSLLKSSATILIVDDQPKNLQVVGSLLAPLGFKLAFANDGIQAIQSATEIKPDLILLDIMMPEINGYAVARKLKEHSETAHIPIIFLSAKNESEDIVEGFKAGGVDYVSKPFKAEELIARVNTHIKIQQLNDQLRLANEQKSELMSIAAHDLKNPLAAIRGLSEIILNSEGENADFELEPEERHNLLKDINQCAENTLNIIKELLNTQTIESGVVKLNIKECDLSFLLMELVDLNTHQAAAKKIKIHNNITDEIMVYVDVPRMREVFDNLISNAVKYSPLGKNIYIEVKEQDAYIRVNVRDEGPGLTQNDLSKVFGKFQKLSARPTGGEHSTGLGLAIVKNLIELHGGQAGVDSVEGEGATFYVDIPKKIALQAEA